MNNNGRKNISQAAGDLRRIETSSISPSCAQTADQLNDLEAR
jgi:hypothetical protein